MREGKWEFGHGQGYRTNFNQKFKYNFKNDGTMAQINNGIFDGISGKLGNLVFYRLNGKTVVRQKPGPRNYIPSEPQIFQQKSFASGQKFLTPLRHVLDQIYKYKRIRSKSGINSALSWILKNAIENHNGEPVLIPEKIFLHRGYLFHLDSLVLERLENEEIRISWQVFSSQDFWREHEKFQVIAYVPEHKLVFWQREGNYRKSGLQIIQLPWTQSHAGQVLLFGGFFNLGKNGGEYSDIMYLGKV
jgi:hypothetical protein